jgi:hypothetical protein
MPSERADRPRIFLSTELAGRAAVRFARAFVLASAALFVAAVPFATKPLAPVTAFIPAYQSALVISDLITAVLLFGQFNYGKRGILDITHSRLFTFASLRTLFEQGGFRVIETRGLPAPFPLALGGGGLARTLLCLNRLLIRISKGLFSYQVFMVLQPCPSPEYLLRTAQAKSAVRGGSPNL